jgi:eukaryotic-like serine/threonine-protein kinase
MSLLENQARTVFLSALEQAPDQWPALLDQACGDNAALRIRVHELLRAHQVLGSIHDDGINALTIEQPIREGPGSVIGPYKLLERIGEGGFGVVFVAEQTQPVRRKVALKLIKPGMDSKQVLARFDAERQALALMDHPNIAKVFDAGAVGSKQSAVGSQQSAVNSERSCPSFLPTADCRLPTDSRPYFVMELVKGIPITRYCDERRLTPRQRLELFVPVCHAIQHAHTKGVIHRDLKPSNVLVARYDDRPVPKVIDFGVAKATGQELTEETLHTAFGAVVGTFEYMSPEQASFNQLDVDTRSDVYSLGVLLYELLAGSPPFTKKELEKTGMLEMLRVIREQEPSKPSRKLSTAEGLPTLAAKRGTEPAKLTRLVRGELDWIAMKALEKNRNRRYETAAGLALDVERYLRHEPVFACPPSWWYRFCKLARRNRALFIGAIGAVLAALLGIAMLAVSNHLIRQEQARTSREKKHADDARQLAEKRAEEVRQGLARLKTANVLLDRGRYYAVDHSWDDAHESFSQAIRWHPDHVSVWVERANLYTRLGLWDLAAADYAREMELHGPDTTLRWYQHALLRRAVGDEEGCRQTARAMRERFAGTLKVSFTEETVRSSLLVPDPAVDLSRLIELCRDAIPTRPASMPYVLGTAHYRAGQYDEAIRRLEGALAAQPQWPVTRLSYPVLAMAHHRLGQEAQARQALEEAARILDRWTQERYTGNGEDWVTHRGGDAVWPAMWWDYLECQLLYREAKVLIDGAPPPDDPRLHVLRGRALAGLDLVEQAAPEFEAAWKLSPDDALIRLETHRNRGACGVHRRQWRDAAAEFAKAVELRPDDPKLWRFRAVALFADGDFDAHRQTCMAMLERFARTEDRFAAGNLLLACVLRDDVLPDMVRLLPIARVSDPLWHWGAEVRGAALYRAGRYEESVQCFEAAARMYRPRPWDWCFLAMAHHRLGHADEARRCLLEATGWIDAANHSTEDDPTGTLPAWGGWDQPVVYPLLVREAENLMKNESGTKEADPIGNRCP